jgi:hypothetical protein
LVFPLTLSYRINVLILFILPFLLFYYQKIIGYPERRAIKNIIFLLVFPTAFFLQANYTETLYIVLASSILILLLKHKYFNASLLGILLTATKVNGISICFVIFLSYLLSHDNKKPLDYFKATLYAVIPVIGILFYFIYLQSSFGSYIIFFKSQAEWGRLNGAFSSSYLLNYFEPIIKSIITGDISLLRRFSEFGSVILAIILLVKSFKKIPLEVWFYSLIQVIIPIATGSFLSFNRLILLAFPLLLFFLNSLRSRKSIIIYLALCIPLQILFIYLFLNNIFIG